MALNNNRLSWPWFYHYSFDKCRSPIDWGQGDDWMLIVKFRFWKLNQPEEHNHSATECSVNLLDVRDSPARSILLLRHHLTLLGVSQMCHAKMVANLIHYIVMEFIPTDGSAHLRPRLMVVMDIVDASDIIVDDLVVENTVRRFIGMEPVGQDQRLRSWEAETVYLRDTIQTGASEFVEEVRVIRTELTRQDYLRVEAAMNEILGERVAVHPVEGDWDTVIRESMEDHSARMVPASEEAIASLEKVLECDRDGVEITCVICNEENEQQGFSRMACTHVFHTKCIETWLRLSSSCPLCRYVMP